MSADGARPRSVWTIVVAAGGGTRFGGPKQYAPIGARRVLDWTLAAARSASDGVVLVVPSSLVDQPEPGADAVVAGGATRSESVRKGLAAVPDRAEVVLVHDAARPAASAELFTKVAREVTGEVVGVVPAVPVIDSLRWRDGGAVDRDLLVAVQTPQGFAAEALRAAHATAGEASDDATLVEQAGGRVVTVEGEAANIKLTHPADLDALARHLLGEN